MKVYSKNKKFFFLSFNERKKCMKSEGIHTIIIFTLPGTNWRVFILRLSLLLKKKKKKQCALKQRTPSSQQRSSGNLPVLERTTACSGNACVLLL